MFEVINIQPIIFRIKDNEYLFAKPNILYKNYSLAIYAKVKGSTLGWYIDGTFISYNQLKEKFLNKYMKTITINRYYNKKGNSYPTRNVDSCLYIICKKLKVSQNPEVNDDYYKNINLYNTIEKQVKEQYNCNDRKINFKIEL